MKKNIGLPAILHCICIKNCSEVRYCAQACIGNGVIGGVSFGMRGGGGRFGMRGGGMSLHFQKSWWFNWVFHRPPPLHSTTTFYIRLPRF